MGMAQIGGKAGYQSFNVANNPRSAALGGTTISLADGDVTQFLTNPATLDSVADGNAFIHVNPFFADAMFYSLGYVFNVKKLKKIALGIHYLSFGNFDLLDDTGQSLGRFTASDFSFNLSTAHRLGSAMLGASLKFLGSNIDSYSSSAIAMDLGGVFSLNPNWSIAMTFENIGFQLSDYANFSNVPLPFSVRVGMSFKPTYMPLRFTFTSINLVDSDFEKKGQGASNKLLDKVLRRVNFGAEILLTKNVQLLAGYSHRRRQELRLEDIGRGAGFSYGIMLRVKRLQLRFSRAMYHVAGGINYISIQTSLKNHKKIL